MSALDIKCVRPGHICDWIIDIVKQIWYNKDGGEICLRQLVRVLLTSFFSSFFYLKTADGWQKTRKKWGVFYLKTANEKSATNRVE